MPANTVSRGNVLYQWIIAPTLTPVIVNTITAPEQSFTVPGLQMGDFVTVAPAIAQTAGVGILTSRVSAANTLTIQFVNPTAGNLTPVAGKYYVEILRPESPADLVANAN